jgi:hypothetical protein
VNRDFAPVRYCRAHNASKLPITRGPELKIQELTGVASRRSIQSNKRIANNGGSYKDLDLRLRQLLKRIRGFLSKMDARKSRPGRMAILSLGCLVAAYLSEWSYVFLGAALVLAALALYTWPPPRRRRNTRGPRRAQQATVPLGDLGPFKGPAAGGRVWEANRPKGSGSGSNHFRF